MDAKDVEQSEKTRINRNFCHQYTNHEVKGDHGVKWYEDEERMTRV
jgi:hypothetical protein